MTDERPPPPLCVFCSAPWTDEMLKVYAKGDYDFGYYPGEFSVDGYDVTIDVTCSTCGRLVYRKEVRQDLDRYGIDADRPGRVRADSTKS
jgi:hypothetical protein